MDRAVLKQQLESMGIRQIQDAANGKDGLFRIENALGVGKPFHLIVTDWRMPEHDGLKLLKFVRSHDKIKNTAILMVTAVFEVDKVTEAVVSKVDGYIIKPSDFDKLKDRVYKALQKRGLENAA